MAVTTEIDVRYRDLDELGHVNNAVIASYVEDARLNYIDEVFEIGPTEFWSLIAHFEVDFERPIQLEDSVVIAVEVPELGTTSVPMDYEITADGERAASAETVLVFTDEVEGSPTPIPEDIRERVAAYEEL